MFKIEYLEKSVNDKINIGDGTHLALKCLIIQACFATLLNGYDKKILNKFNFSF